ncbi:Sedoheptulose-1,7-bisphosphatase, chloroplastic [Trichinella nelsoni]|uniref:Sedoheptulose-1,7-bisphosphatase, chloroplastic n=1 Tax=Trichinella nelsoni TaxID=6336 RepID=A0A0V0RAW3_9BILA|nr:Sedoheptulose-1,7-bisphosphatase, chloroplastic [Trichinella nelsoni]
MEASIACCSARAFLPGVSTQHSTALAAPSAISPSFSSKSLKSTSLFGESLRQVPRSSLKLGGVPYKGNPG